MTITMNLIFSADIAIIWISAINDTKFDEFSPIFDFLRELFNCRGEVNTMATPGGVKFDDPELILFLWCFKRFFECLLNCSLLSFPPTNSVYLSKNLDEICVFFIKTLRWKTSSERHEGKKE